MATSSFFHKPELALRRAEELEGINQEEAALGILHEVLSSRRHRTWMPAFEQIMIKYLDLCLRMSKSREAKDGLHQYRNLSQTQAPASLEKVIRHLMDRAERKCSEAKAYVDAEAFVSTTTTTTGGAGGDEEDDEGGFAASPQAILLSTMSTDPAKSQRDSTVLLPSLKFLWETYRAVLDILRSNSKLEHVYHIAAQNALNFCRVYKRRMEFRHLCDMLRMHLGNLRQYGSVDTGDDTKSSNKVRGWEGWTSESIELHLQTRFAQLETASALHRYTDGFRTVEDIYNILQISHARRKANPDSPPPKAKLMAAYYEKLTTLFWVSENYLFHAFAWYKYYSLSREYNRGMSEETKIMQASAVLLAALCIPHRTHMVGAGGNKQHGISSTAEDDIIKQKMARMATLLGFHTRNPTREALLMEIRSKNILDQVPPYLRELYLLLEETSDPLVMVERARPLLQQLKQEIGATTTTDEANDDVEDTTLGRYVKPLTSVLLLKLVVNLSSAYHTVSLANLKKLTEGLDMSFEQVEKALVHFTQTKVVSLRIDHRAGCLRFGDAQLESDVMRSQLTVLSKQLEAVMLLLNPPNRIVSQQIHAKAYETIRSGLEEEHLAILERKNIIEKRKEEAERLVQEKIREELRIKAEEEAARKAEEEQRILREQRLREQEKKRKIQQDMENQEKKRVLVALGRNVEDMSAEEIAKLDTETLQKEHQEMQTKAREEGERKLRDAAKKLDYLVRAIRIEELPMIKKKYDHKIKRDRERYEQESQEKVKMAKIQWEIDVKDKAVLEQHNVFQYLAQFEAAVTGVRRSKYVAICREEDANAEIEAERAKIRRARKRKDDEAKRIAAEAARRKQEEEDRIAGEERRKKEETRRAKEVEDEELRQADAHRDEEEHRSENQQSSSLPPQLAKSGGGGAPVGGASEARGKYVPPSRRGGTGGGGGGGGGGPDNRSSRLGGGDAYPGGGRYEGRTGGGGGRSDERPGERWRGGPGAGGGGGGGGDDRRGGGGDDRRGGVGGGDDRRGGAGGGDRRGFDDRRGGGGGGGFDDRRGQGNRRDDRRDGGSGGGSSGAGAGAGGSDNAGGSSGRWR